MSAGNTLVWVIETGDYEQRHVFGVAESPHAAIEHIKAEYAKPYRVDWSPPSASVDGRHWSITGRFECVEGLSTAHVARYHISSFSLWRERP